ncbi:MAG: hypothetical protein P1U68_09780 [Verrucomicrobiales bacterium]|nr:hypothetical protein [Verrucomicrobiales bacterium]
MRRSPLSFCTLSTILLLALCPVWPLSAQDIPDELLEDEHVREEFGVNKFTTPSIKKIFADLQKLRPLPYDELKRVMPEQPPKDRTHLAITVGLLLADGFFAVEAEQFFDLEPVGRSLLQHASNLGSGTRISSHMKSMLEKGALSDWDELKNELSRTQKDVEKEMVLIRDVDAANLVSLGGWLRAFEIGTAASLVPYDPAKASTLARPEIIEYFVLNLETLEPRIKENELVKEIQAGLLEIQKRTTLPEQEILSEAEVQELRILVEGLVDKAYGSARLIEITKTGQGKTDPGEAPTTTKPAATGGVISGEVPE